MSKKKKISIIIIVVLLLIVCIVAVPILLVGWPVIGEILFDRPSKPSEKHGEFTFNLVYEYDGEEFIVTESIICDYEGISFSPDRGTARDWNCYITNNNEHGRYYLDKEKYPTLYIQVPLDAEYYMGSPDADIELANPYIFLVDESTGTTYYEQDLMNVVGAKITSWEVESPLEGNIK